MVTKDEVEESYGSAYGGTFDTQRYVALASPKLDWANSPLRKPDRATLVQVPV